MVDFQAELAGLEKRALAIWSSGVFGVHAILFVARGGYSITVYGTGRQEVKTASFPSFDEAYQAALDELDVTDPALLALTLGVREAAELVPAEGR